MKGFDLQNIKNGGGGFLIAIIGLLFLINTQDLRLGQFQNMGPGMFPYILSLLTIACGLIIALYDVIKSMKKNEVSFDVRGVLAVGAAFAIFAFFIEPAGIFLTTLLSVFLIATAQPKFRFFESLWVGVGLALFVWAVFSLGLGMPLHFGPGILR